MSSAYIEPAQFARVYVVQEPLRKSMSSGKPVPLFDLAPASAFGEIITCLDWSDTKADFLADDLLVKLRNALHEFNDDDYLLMTGNPTAMALAAIVAAEVNEGRFNLLVWTKRGTEGFYRVMQVNTWAEN